MTQPMIMVAPNGARRGTFDHPALPVTLDAIIATTICCHHAGADALHLHIRDSAGCHTLDPGRYREALTALADAVPTMAVQITTESAGLFTPQQQLDCLLALQPRWASVALREIACDAEVAQRLYAACADQETRVQHIAFGAQDLAVLAGWQASGIVRPRQNEVICVLGSYAPPRAGQPADLAELLGDLSTFRWAACAFGPQEQQCLLAAADAGAEILRVGFENNLIAPDGAPWRDNAAAVAALRACLVRGTDSRP